MKPAIIAIIIVALLVVFMAYTVWAKDTVEVKAGDYGTVKGEITVHYSDGTTKTITKVKTANLNTASIKNNGTTINKFTFSLAYNPNKNLNSKEVRVLSDKADAEHMSQVTVKATQSTSTSDIATYPLSIIEKSPYITCPSGEYKTIWGEITVTAQEMETANSVWALGTNYLIFVVKIWINIDKDSSQVEGFVVEFRVPFTILTFVAMTDIDWTKDDPNRIPEADDPPGDISEPYSVSDFVVNQNVQMDQTIETKFSVLNTSTSSTAAWKSWSGWGGSGFEY